MKHAISLGLALALFLTGCKAPAPAPSGPPEAAESLSPVYADWSRLTPYETPERAEVYPRRDGPRDVLVPAPDYGPLVPFPGAVMTSSWYAGEWVTSYLYGLMTLEGEAVVDPVYSSVTLLTRGNGGDTPDPLPAMVLTRYTGEKDPETGEAVFRSALAARDGSWVTEEVYTFDPDLQYGGMDVEPGQLFALRGENVLVLLDPETGAELFSAPLPGALSRDSRYDALWSAQAGDGRVTVSCYDASAQTSQAFCWTLDGQAVPLPQDVTQVGRFSQGLAPARNSGGQWGYLDASGAWAIPPQYSYARPFENGSALVRGGGFSLISPAGDPRRPRGGGHLFPAGRLLVLPGVQRRPRPGAGRSAPERRLPPPLPNRLLPPGRRLGHSGGGRRPERRPGCGALAPPGGLGGQPGDRRP